MSDESANGNVLSAVFAWVLQDSQSQGAAASPDYHMLMMLNGLSDAESCMLWCFLAAIREADPDRRAAADAVAGSLDLPGPFVDTARPAIAEAVGGLDPAPDAETIVHAPPAALMEAINSQVVRYARQFRRSRVVLDGLDAVAFQHPADRAMLRSLKAIPAVGTLIGKGLDFIVRSHELRLLSNAIEITASSMPTVHDCYLEACRVLGIGEPLPLYAMPGPINAFCVGAERPYLQVSSILLNLLNREELLFILGHELGHAMSGHPKYHTLASAVSGLSGGLLSKATLGLSEAVVNTTVSPALFAWMRRSEFTADRAGYLACQNREAALRVLMKLSGYPITQFRFMRTDTLAEQARRYEQAMRDSAFDRLRNVANLWSATHPLTIVRAAELIDWIDSGEPQTLIDAGAQGRRAVARTVEQDPGLQLLMLGVQRTLTDWAARHTGQPTGVLRPLVQRMLYEGVPTDGTPLEPLLRVELHAAKRNADEMQYTLVVLAQRGAEVDCVEIPLPVDGDWDQAPQVIRRQWLRNGGQPVIHLLYSPQTAAAA